MATITSAQFTGPEQGAPVKVIYDDSSTAVVYGFGSGAAAEDLQIWLQSGGGVIAAAPADAPTDREPASIVRRKDSDEYQVLDKNGKAIATFKRDAAGNAEMQAVDTNGNTRRVLTPQQGTMKLDAVATIADVTFDQAFTEHPVVHLTPDKLLPQHSLVPNKTGFQLSFASAPSATIAWEAKPAKRK